MLMNVDELELLRVFFPRVKTDTFDFVFHLGAIT